MHSLVVLWLFPMTSGKIKSLNSWYPWSLTFLDCLIKLQKTLWFVRIRRYEDGMVPLVNIRTIYARKWFQWAKYKSIISPTLRGSLDVK